MNKGIFLIGIILLAIGFLSCEKGKALNIKQARLTVQDIELQKEVDLSNEYVEFTVELEKGETQLQTWFTLDNEVEIGAYYVEIEKL